MAWRRSESTRGVDRQILALAVPAFLALVAEPLFLLADSAIVGHLGTAELAGLGIASVVLRLAIGLCVFLAYATTAAVARELGAGQPRRALQQGVDGLWLALLIGVVLTVAGVLTTEPLIALFGTDPDVTAAATTYLRISWLGLTPMLLLLAATGVLRGLADTRTPLVVAVAANLLNIVLNVVLVYGFDLGIGGSAAGTVLAQTAAGLYLAGAVLRAAAARGGDLAPRPSRRTTCRARRLRAAGPDPQPACLPADDDLGCRDAGDRGHRRAPAGLHAVDVPGLRPRRPGDRRPDPDRDRAGRR